MHFQSPIICLTTFFPNEWIFIKGIKVFINKIRNRKVAGLFFVLTAQKTKRKDEASSIPLGTWMRYPPIEKTILLVHFPATQQPRRQALSKSTLPRHLVILYLSPWQCLDRHRPCLPGAYILQINKTLLNTIPPPPKKKPQSFYNLGYKSHIFPPCVMHKMTGSIPKPHIWILGQWSRQEATLSSPGFTTEPEPARVQSPGRVRDSTSSTPSSRVRRAPRLTSPKPPHIARPTSQKGPALLAAQIGGEKIPCPGGSTAIPSDAPPAPLANCYGAGGRAAQSRERAENDSRRPREEAAAAGPEGRRVGLGAGWGRGGEGRGWRRRAEPRGSNPGRRGPRPEPPLQTPEDVGKRRRRHRQRLSRAAERITYPSPLREGPDGGGGARRVPWVSRTPSSPHPVVVAAAVVVVAAAAVEFPALSSAGQ